MGRRQRGHLQALVPDPCCHTSMMQFAEKTKRLRIDEERERIDEEREKIDEEEDTTKPVRAIGLAGNVKVGMTH